MSRVPQEPVHTVPRVRLRLRRARDGAAAEGVPVVLVEGELDIDTVPELDRFLRRRLGPFYERQHLLLDLKGVTFADSSFIGFLVRLASAQRRTRRELVLTRPVGQVRTVLSLVGLPNLVPVFESIEEGERAMAQQGPLIPPLFNVAG